MKCQGASLIKLIRPALVQIIWVLLRYTIRLIRSYIGAAIANVKSFVCEAKQ